MIRSSHTIFIPGADTIIKAGIHNDYFLSHIEEYEYADFLLDVRLHPQSSLDIVAL